MDYSNQSNQDLNQSQQSSFEDIKPKPENNLVLAIIGTILGLCSPCCIGLIVGIVAIVFSNQVNTKYAIGDYAGAEQAAKNTKILAYIALGLGILGVIINIVTLVTGGIDAYMDQYQSILDNTGGGSIDD
ncbi:CD225/dispanin family protein [Empedobacter tilapiae]|uniref:CD225/dispanin family protein n=1 Tax=Empedobacter tilapiae TaxID=2491114 RepID=A0A4Z1BDD0_9FLAO|nr:CD225/dispanin family protein [Empedobacter tilapiae]TGN26664.1 CD225/dispanin family protein [Empedobacter tilapiae]